MSHKDRVGELFDRTSDVSKLIGCNTRNVKYRWTIFQRHLTTIPPSCRVLDLGAGSLRETHDLTMKGFQVTAVDLDKDALEFYKNRYDWQQAKHKPDLYTGTLSSLLNRMGKGGYDLALAFDVFEHLERPEETLAYLWDLLGDDGLLFCTVPNKFTLFEMYFHFQLLAAKLLKKNLTPGSPHLQRKSTKEWLAFYQDNGFSIVEHDMAIGFFVNTWAALCAIPVRSIGIMLREFGFHIGEVILGNMVEEKFYPKWLMKRMNVCDEKTKGLLRGLFAWNVIVARKRKKASTAA